MIKRKIVQLIEPWIKREEILFINGPRQVGKTTLMKGFQCQLDIEGEKTYYFNLENPNDLALTEDYDLFLQSVLPNNSSKTIVFLDEIQLHSKPSNFLKFLYDEYRANIKIFVSGSANLDIKAKIQDSLAGRKKDFYLSPFNFEEFLEAKKIHSKNNPISEAKHIQILLDEYLLYGGLPKVVLEDDYDMKKDLLNEYTATYISKDIRHMITENHVITFNNLLIFLAKIMGSLKNNSTISKNLSLNHITLSRYLDLLRHTFVIHFLEPYFTNEITRIKKSSKIYFFDNGVRNSLLSNFSTMDKRSDAGALYENSVFLHLQQTYSKNSVFYLRTISNNEIDFICKTQEGSVDLYEAKYSDFKNPTISRGFKNIMKTITFKSAYLVNKNLNNKSGDVEFVSFDQFVKNN